MTPGEAKALTLAEFRAFSVYRDEWVKAAHEANKG